MIQTLETLKKESAEIAAEVEKVDDTMREIEIVSNEYVPLSNMSSRIFFSLESMSQTHFLYQFSLQHFMEIIYSVIQKNAALAAVPSNEHERRLVTITAELFNEVYAKISLSLLNEHKILFAMRLAQIRLQDDC